ncbi:MAG: HDOD domain-containing protein [Pseudomonadales bacterium]|jgi:HD-like signal output (HDOD) protein|nr:HDOD domain-containing protein [Pseudomonadales bacterium]
MDTPVDQMPLYPNPPGEQRVRALFCSDNKGQIQVVAPEIALVDPEPIRVSTARDVRHVPQAENASVCAIPGFYGFPSIVDSQLKEKSVIALATEVPGQYVRATGAQLHQMCLNHASFETQFTSALTGTPANREQDQQDIERAVLSFTARRIEARLDETLAIPPLPETAQRIIALAEDPMFDLNDIVTIIESDPAIAARIMGWANSAFYGTPTPSKTLNDAIMRVLGFDMVFNMALGMAIGDSLNLPESHVSGASPYWLDAVYSAATVEALSRQAAKDKQINPGTAYLTGLLSNFGTLVVGHVFPPQYASICRIQEANPSIGYPEIDQHVLHVNREVLAATLLELWDLPEEITTAVRFQNVGGYVGEHQDHVALLRLAQDLLCYGPDGLHEDSLATATQMGISELSISEVAEVILSAQNELSDLAFSLGQ